MSTGCDGPRATLLQSQILLHHRIARQHNWRRNIICNAGISLFVAKKKIRRNIAYQTFWHNCTKVDCCAAVRVILRHRVPAEGCPRSTEALWLCTATRIRLRPRSGSDACAVPEVTLQLTTCNASCQVGTRHVEKLVLRRCHGMYSRRRLVSTRRYCTAPTHCNYRTLCTINRAASV